MSEWRLLSAIKTANDRQFCVFAEKYHQICKGLLFVEQPIQGGDIWRFVYVDTKRGAVCIHEKKRVMKTAKVCSFYCTF